MNFGPANITNGSVPEQLGNVDCRAAWLVEHFKSSCFGKPEKTKTAFDSSLFYNKSRYRTSAIITRSLYILNPLFESQKRFFKVFSENSVFMYG